MGGRTTETVTGLLQAWRGGDAGAMERLVPRLYGELHRLARGCMRGERAGHTLQATALVHEAYARMIDLELGWQDRVHFLAVAARTMRRVLVDHARGRDRLKRGGRRERLSLDERMLVTTGRSAELLTLDAALTRLALIDERKARAIELRYFGGLSWEETAEALGVSRATAHRELRMAKAWLRREMSLKESA